MAAKWTIWPGTCKTLLKNFSGDALLHAILP